MYLLTKCASCAAPLSLRRELNESIGIHAGLLWNSRKNLGTDHPTTLGIRASLKLCFEEQFDWRAPDDLGLPREDLMIIEDIRATTTGLE